MSGPFPLATPWARSSGLYSTPGRLILKLRLGEGPEGIPTAFDVRSGAVPPASGIGDGAVERILRRFTERSTFSRVYAAAASLGRPGRLHVGFGDVEHALGLARTFRVHTDRRCCIADLVDALRQLGSVEEAYPHYHCTTPMASAPAAPSLDLGQAWPPREQVKGPAALACEPGDPAVIVAIVDTGIARRHPALRLRAGWDTVQLSPRDFVGSVEILGDQVEPDDDPDDDVVGHGTACAGIIGARGEGLPPGLAGECGVLPIRVLGSARFPGHPEPIGVGSITDIDAGIKMAMDLGAKVLNLSLGTAASALGEGDPECHADVVRYGLAKGCVMVAASGNTGTAQRFLPAALDGVIAVGSASPEGRPSAFSTSGEHVALLAPGERVLTTGRGGYQRVTGTSFAAPFVAGAAALLVSRAMRQSFPLDGRDVSRLLRESARPLPAGTPAGHGRGVLDAHAALRRLEREIAQRATAHTSLREPASEGEIAGSAPGATGPR